MSELQAPLFRYWASTPSETRHSAAVVLNFSSTHLRCVACSEEVVRLVLDVGSKYDVEKLESLAPPPLLNGFVELPKFEMRDAQGKLIKQGIGFALTNCAGSVAEAPWWIVDVYTGRTDNGKAQWSGSFVYLSGSNGGSAMPSELEEWLCGQFKVAPKDKDFFMYQQQLQAHIFTATCAVLAAPGMRSVNEKRRALWLQKKRQACPHIDYRCIDIDIDALADVPESGGPFQGGGSPKALHHVRGHLRLTEKSGLTPVRPHWRGNAAYGTKLRDFNIKRTEEMQ